MAVYQKAHHARMDELKTEEDEEIILAGNLQDKSSPIAKVIEYVGK